MPSDPQKRNLRFALDQNFPKQIVDLAALLTPRVSLVPLLAIGPDYPHMEDWELFQALDGQFDGLITNDANLLHQAKEMVVFHSTSLSLVVTEKVGHIPAKAVGLVLSHIDHIERGTNGTAQIWRLGRPHQRAVENPYKYIQMIAEKSNRSVAEVISAFSGAPDSGAASSLDQGAHSR